MGKKRKQRDDESKESSPSDVEEGGKAPSPKRLKTEGGVGTPASETVDERDKLQLLVSAFSNAQQDQYEIYRRSTFPKSSIRKLMQGVCGSTVPQNAVIAMAGITKVYVGELVEAACQARDRTQEEGPLQPKHIREAVRTLKNNDKIPTTKYKKVFPTR